MEAGQKSILTRAVEGLLAAITAAVLISSVVTRDVVIILNITAGIAIVLAGAFAAFSVIYVVRRREMSRWALLIPVLLLIPLVQAIRDLFNGRIEQQKDDVGMFTLFGAGLVVAAAAGIVVLGVKWQQRRQPPRKKVPRMRGASPRRGTQVPVLRMAVPPGTVIALLAGSPGGHSFNDGW